MPFIRGIVVDPLETFLDALEAEGPGSESFVGSVVPPSKSSLSIFPRPRKPDELSELSCDRSRADPVSIFPAE